MAIGDDAAAAGYPLVPSTGAGAEVALGAQEINRTRDMIAELKTFLGNYRQTDAKWKAGDTERTATTVLADPDLSFPMQAYSTYRVIGNINWVGTRDMPFGWNYPSGALGRYTINLLANTVGFVTDSFGFDYSLLASHGNSGMLIAGTIWTEATAGNLTFKWGMYASSGGDYVTVQKGSCLEFTKLA